MADTSLQRYKRRGGARWDGVGREQSEKIEMDNLAFYLICRIKESLVNNNGKEANPIKFKCNTRIFIRTFRPVLLTTTVVGATVVGQDRRCWLVWTLIIFWHSGINTNICCVHQLLCLPR